MMSYIISFSMYYLSFVPLWITILFIDIKSIIVGGGYKWTEIISIIAILTFLLISLIVLFVKFNSKNDERYMFTIRDAKECKTITSEYLISYILPLFAFDFTLWDEVVEFMIFFIVLGFLCIYHNNFSVNIILELLQYRFYECSLINADNIEVEKIIISRDILSTNKGGIINVKVINNEYSLDVSG